MALILAPPLGWQSTAAELVGGPFTIALIARVCPPHLKWSVSGQAMLA